MKKLLLISLTVLVLAACGNSQSTSDPVNKTEKQENEVKKEETKQTEEKNEDKTLTEPGQKITDKGVGTVTLDKIVNINKVYETAGLKIKLLDAKVITMTNIDPTFKENVQQMSSNIEIGNVFTYLQIRYDLENTTKEKIIFNGMETAIPDNGKQIDITTTNIFSTDNPANSEIYSKATVDKNIIGIPVDKNIKSIRLIPADVLYDNNDLSIFYPKEINIIF